MRNLAATAMLILLAGCQAPKWAPGPARPIGPPLRLGERLYLLTNQSLSRYGFSSDPATPRVIDSELFTDLWAFDTKSAAPLWRKRIRASKEKGVASQSILGADANTLWVYLPEGLHALSAETGDILASPQSIEAANPVLKGLLPRQSSYYSFGANGLQLRAADGREWHLDSRTFTAQPPGQPSSSAVAPAYFTPNATYMFQQRSLPIPGRWLGLLTAPEAAQLRETGEIGDMDSQSRRKLWGGRVAPGPRHNNYTELTPLTDEFLAPGLLTLNNRPLLTSKPDSVLVLHQDRLGDERRLQLARVAGPGGSVLWNAALPFSVLQSVLPGKDSLALCGVQFTPRKASDTSDPHHTARHYIAMLDLASGAMQTFNLSDVDSNPPATRAAKPAD